MSDPFDYCEALVREADRDRYLSALLVPLNLRPDLFALYAFNVELSLVGDRAKEPLAGEARLQWWLQAVDGATADVAANPVAAALMQTIDRHALDREALRRMIRGRMADLFEQMPDTASFESYLRDTAGSLFALAGQVLGGDGPRMHEAANEAGIAYGAVQILRNIAFHAHRGKILLPQDILQRSGADRENILRGEATKPYLNALAELRQQTRSHLERANSEIEKLPPPARRGFLPLALVSPYLRIMEKPDYDPFRTAIEIPQWKRQWLLWRSS